MTNDKEVAVAPGPQPRFYVSMRHLLSIYNFENRGMVGRLANAADGGSFLTTPFLGSIPTAALISCTTNPKPKPLAKEKKS